MALANKPIHSQPGGQGKLFTSTTGRSYEGTYLLPNGKYDRRKFKASSNREAVSMYEKWCADMDARVEQAMLDAIRPKRKDGAGGVKELQETEERDMAARSSENGKVSEVIYVVMVVGGVAVAWCETLDKAVAVCDALTLGAKASGFAAKYDVLEVKKWTA